MSGPGALSRRTDGGPAQQLRDLPNAKYGENQQFQQLQQGAPLAQSPQPQFDANSLPPNPAAQSVVPFSQPTQRPDEPVTHGAAMGAGAGPEALGIQPAQVEAKDMRSLAANMPLFQMLANLPNASPSARLMVNLLKANS